MTLEGICRGIEIAGVGVGTFHITSERKALKEQKKADKYRRKIAKHQQEIERRERCYDAEKAERLNRYDRHRIEKMQAWIDKRMAGFRAVAEQDQSAIKERLDAMMPKDTGYHNRKEC